MLHDICGVQPVAVSPGVVFMLRARTRHQDNDTLVVKIQIEKTVTDTATYTKQEMLAKVLSMIEEHCPNVDEYEIEYAKTEMAMRNKRGDGNVRIGRIIAQKNSEIDAGIVVGRISENCYVMPTVPLEGWEDYYLFLGW